MIKKKWNELEWLQFEIFAEIPGLFHAIFLKKGGNSTGHFSSLNLSYNVFDDPLAVQKNISKVQEILVQEHPSAKLYWSQACHGRAITKIHSFSPQEEGAFDALATCEKGVALLIKHADCQAAILYDTKNHIAANIHSGWRGTVQNIYAETVHFLQKNYQTKPENLLVGIGPSLGPQEAEFKEYKTEFPSSFWAFQVKPFYFNLWEIGRQQLMASGVLPHHIEIAEICTKSNPEDFFSYRRNKITGRNGTIVMLK